MATSTTNKVIEMSEIKKFLDGKGKLWHSSELPEFYQDALVVAALTDLGSTGIAASYKMYGTSQQYKDEVFESVMHIIDAYIDAHNKSLPVLTFNERDLDRIFLVDHMSDAGHKPSDF